MAGSSFNILFLMTLALAAGKFLRDLCSRLNYLSRHKELWVMKARLNGKYLLSRLCHYDLI